MSTHQPQRPDDTDNPLPSDAIHARTAADLLRINRSCIWRWVLKGKIPGWMVGGRLMVSRADVLAQVKPVKTKNGHLPPEPVETVRRRRSETHRQLREMGIID